MVEVRHRHSAPLPKIGRSPKDVPGVSILCKVDPGEFVRVKRPKARDCGLARAHAVILPLSGVNRTWATEETEKRREMA